MRITSMTRALRNATQSDLAHRLKRRAPYLGCCAVALLAAGIAVPPTARGDSPAAGKAVEQVAATVSLSDLDLGTSQGMREARARLATAARRLCRKWSDDRKIDDRANYARCTQETLAQALAQLPGPQLDARN